MRTIDSQKLAVDEARLMPHLRANASPLLERHRMERSQAAALDAVLAEGVAGSRPRGAAKMEPAELRGIPAIGRGVTGAIKGTAPHLIRFA